MGIELFLLQSDFSERPSAIGPTLIEHSSRMGASRDLRGQQLFGPLEINQWVSIELRRDNVSLSLAWGSALDRRYLLQAMARKSKLKWVAGPHLNLPLDKTFGG
jgi:hypothetical protein